MTTDTLAAPASKRSALWAYPFRPFFIAVGLYAILAVGGWLGVLLLGWPLNGKFLNMQWHSHEMLFGFVPAAIAGFLLTAMCNWTRSAPLAGAKLQALFGLWLAGRAAMWLAGTLPHWLILVIDCAFLFAVAVYAGRVIVGSGNYRNLPLVAVVTTMALANLLFHAGWWNNDFALVRRVELGMVMLIVLLMVIIGGRITPAFTRNWLMRSGRAPVTVKTRPVVETLSVSATALLVLTMLAGAPAPINGAVAAVAGVANAVRVIGWRGWQTHSDALVWILHAAYAWIPLGLLLLAANQLFGKPLSTVWLHALGPGAMAVLIVAVMTRVTVGHTGRELKLASGGIGIYVLIMAAAVVRLVTALGWLPWRGGLLLSSAAWFAAFALFLIVYTPILIAPRADGRPG
ncbi:MAG TPA: NnrS family protein [Wenzhouxiangella sp.]|nr:NnrS family protein [Wenzhouxiangella sp.]